jgi:hypothetical protein
LAILSKIQIFNVLRKLDSDISGKTLNKIQS